MNDRVETRRQVTDGRHAARLVAAVAATGVVAVALATTRGVQDVAPAAFAEAPRAVRALDFTPADRFGGPFVALTADASRVYAVRNAWLEVYRPDGAGGLALEGRVAVPDLDRPFACPYLAASAGVVALVVTSGLRPRPWTRGILFTTHAGELPRRAGEVDIADGVWSAVAAPDRLYVTGGQGIHVFETADPSRPSRASTLQLGDSPLLAAAGTELFIATPAGGLPRTGRVLAYDVRDAAGPRLEAEREVHGWPHAIDIHSGRLLVWTSPWPPSRANHALTVLSAAPPALDELARLDLGAGVSIRDVVVVGRFAVAYGVRPRADDRPFGAHQPEALTFALDGLPDRIALADRRSLPLPLYDAARAWAVQGDTAWVAAQHVGIDALAVDPASGALREAVAVRTLGRAGGLAADGVHVYTADDDAELWSLEVGPTGEVRRGDVTPLVLADGKALASAGGASLTVAADDLVIARQAPPFGGPGYGDPGDVVVVDVSHLDGPVVRSIWRTVDDPLLGIDADDEVGLYGPAVHDGHLLVSHAAGVVEIDASRAGEALARQVFGTERCPMTSRPFAGNTLCRGLGLAVADDHVYAARGGHGILVFDLGVGVSTVVDHLPAPDAVDVALDDSAIYVADRLDGLRVFDRRAARFASLSGLFTGLRIAVAGTTVFVVGAAVGGNELDGTDAPFEARVWAVDVADPFQPLLRGHVSAPLGENGGMLWDRPPHVLPLGRVLVATEPQGGITTYRLTDGRPLPASRLALPIVVVAR